MLSIKEWQIKYKLKYFADGTKKKLVEAGWYDWFCSYDELNIKTKQYSKWILKIHDSAKLSIDKNGMIFINKLRMDGLYYDSIKMVDIENDIDILLIDIYEGDNGFFYIVYDIKEFNKKIFETNYSDELVVFLNS